MKKILTLFFVSALFFSCIKKNETTSTEAENLKEDVKDVKKDIKEFANSPKDSIVEDVKDDLKRHEGLEGSKNREFY